MELDAHPEQEQRKFSSNPITISSAESRSHSGREGRCSCQGYICSKRLAFSVTSPCYAVVTLLNNACFFCLRDNWYSPGYKTFQNLMIPKHPGAFGWIETTSDDQRALRPRLTETSPSNGMTHLTSMTTTFFLLFFLCSFFF